MQTQIGKALFFVGIIVAIAAGSPFTKWEAVTEAFDEAGLTAANNKAAVDITPFKALKPKEGDADHHAAGIVHGAVVEQLLQRGFNVPTRVTAKVLDGDGKKAEAPKAAAAENNADDGKAEAEKAEAPADDKATGDKAAGANDKATGDKSANDKSAPAKPVDDVKGDGSDAKPAETAEVVAEAPPPKPAKPALKPLSKDAKLQLIADQGGIVRKYTLALPVTAASAAKAVTHLGLKKRKSQAKATLVFSGFDARTQAAKDALVAASTTAGASVDNVLPTVIIRGEVSDKGRNAKLKLTISEATGHDGKMKTLDVATDKMFPSTDKVFWIAALLAAIGGILWRRAQAAQAQAEAAAMAHSESDEGNPFAILKHLVPEVQKLDADFGSLDNAAVMQRVDDLMEKYVAPFAEVRTKVTESLGMEIGAEVLIDVAFGERMLNRVWSAASDDCYEEAVLSLPPALDALERAHRVVEQATDG